MKKMESVERYMNIIKYELLLLAVKYGSVSEAAEELYYSQPGATNMLNRLEKELGVRLLDRKRGRVRLTPEGERLFPYIRQVVEANKEIQENIHSMTGSEKTRLSVGISYSTLSLFTQMSIPAVRRISSELDVWRRIGYCTDLMRWLDSGEIQVALMPLRGKKGYTEIPFGQEEIVAICGKDVPCSLSEDRLVTENELRDVFGESGAVPEGSLSGDFLSWEDGFFLTNMDEYKPADLFWRGLGVCLAFRKFAESAGIRENVRIFGLEGSPGATIGAVYMEGEKETAAIQTLAEIICGERSGG